MTQLKTLKDCIKTIWSEHLKDEHRPDVNSDELKQSIIRDLINIYELEKILKIKLNDKTINILNKYIMWKFNIKEEDLK